MNDLRWDQHAAAVTHAKLRHDPTNTPAVQTLRASGVCGGTSLGMSLSYAELRTVPMPELSTSQARTLDADARGLDCRTADDKLRAELVRLVDVLQGLTLRLEMVEQALREVRG